MKTPPAPKKWRAASLIGIAIALFAFPFVLQRLLTVRENPSPSRATETIGVSDRLASMQSRLIAPILREGPESHRNQNVRIKQIERPRDATGTLFTVRVATERNRPLASCNVKLERLLAAPEVANENPTWTTVAEEVTDTRGQVRFPELEVQHTYSISVRGESSATLQPVVYRTTLDEHVLFEIEAQDTARVEGVCLDSQGVPLPGCRVRVRAEYDGAEYAVLTATTDENGAYGVKGIVAQPGATIRVSASHPAYLDWSQDSVDIPSKAQRGLTMNPLIFQRLGSSITGKLVDSHGRSIRDHELELITLARDHIGRTKTDEHGRFLFQGLQSGVYHLSAAPLCLDGNALAEVDLQDGQSPFSLGTLYTSEGARTLSGFVIDRDGQALSDATVLFAGARTQTDDRGFFHLATCSPGLHTLHVSYRTEESPGNLIYEDLEEVRADGREVTVQIVPTGLALAFIDQESKPLTPESISIIGLGPRRNRFRRAYHEPFGSVLRINRHWATGDWKFIVNAPGYEEQEVVCFVPDDLQRTELQLTIELQPASKLIASGNK